MKKNLLAFLLSVVLSLPAFCQTTYNGTLTLGGPTFNRPNVGMPPTTLSTAATSVYYSVQTFQVTAIGQITFNATSQWDNFIILYNTAGFNPAAPLQNALQSNDDYNGPNAGFTYTFTTPGTYTLVVCSFKNDVVGNFTLNISALTVLPLQLLSFTAANTGGKSNTVNWSSANESNLNFYQVQASIDGIVFKDLPNGNITAKNSASTVSYNFTDNEPANGYNYYRLKITERSGLITYSAIALVKNIQRGITNLTLYPNPAIDYIQIETKSFLNKKAAVSIIGATGVILQNGTHNFNSQGILVVDVRKLPAGKYFLKIAVDKDKAAIPFIKK
ncbi:MAG: T9SS type A sorting domain-containing protein [Ferruginibacter sp.]